MACGAGDISGDSHDMREVGRAILVLAGVPRSRWREVNIRCGAERGAGEAFVILLQADEVGHCGFGIDQLPFDRDGQVLRRAPAALRRHRYAH
jgi:hypothetical protein